MMELIRTLWRGKWTILLATIIALCLGGYYALGLADPDYQSRAELTLEVRTGQVVDIESVMSGVSTETAALNTEIEIILSGRLLGKLVDELALTEDPEFNPDLREPSPMAIVTGTLRGLIAPLTDRETREDDPQVPRNKAIDLLRNTLTASVRRDTYVFTIAATTGDPDKSARIVNTLANLYLEDQISVKFEATEQAVAWLSQRVTELEQEFRQKEDALTTARAETELISPEALQGLNVQAKDLRERLEDMRASAARAEASAEQLQDLAVAGDRAAIVEETGDPTLQGLLADIAAGDADAETLFAQRLDTLVENARNTAARIRSQANALADSYQTLQQRIDRQSVDLARIQQMEREAEATRTLYETFLTRLKETTVQRGLQQADSRILSDAIPGEKVAPRTTRIAALSLVLGAMIGIAIVLVRQFMHNSFRSAEELESATGLPVLGQIPKMPFEAREGLIGYLHDKPTSAAAEAVRNLRTSLLLSDIDNPPKVIMSTSAVPGEGKTTQAIALTQNLAGLDKKVLLIEGDIRRQTLSEYFRDVPEGGILTALSGEKPLHEVVFHDDRLGADVLMGEKSRVNAADLFSSDRFRDFLNRARDAYDFVIIDTPPVLMVPDGRVIGQHADAILFSVAWDRTNRTQVMAALREFESVKLRITGIALAQIDPKGMRRYGYTGGYGAYSGYGKGYYDAT
ncbi:GumC family protein [Roseovarius tibetensis]|uniref:GumC family protein n=1 Tax=Roseovarius tibetensis TaxID=2685897 RepID=UPI003D7F8617